MPLWSMFLVYDVRNATIHVIKMTTCFPAEVTDKKDGDADVGAYLLG